MGILKGKGMYGKRAKIIFTHEDRRNRDGAGKEKRNGKRSGELFSGVNGAPLMN